MIDSSMSETNSRRFKAIRANRAFARAMLRHHPERCDPKQALALATARVPMADEDLKSEAMMEYLREKRQKDSERRRQKRLDNKRRLFAPLLEAGGTAKEIGRKMRCHPNHVYRLAKEIGVEVAAPKRGE